MWIDQEVGRNVWVIIGIRDSTHYSDEKLKIKNVGQLKCSIKPFTYTDSY